MKTYSLLSLNLKEIVYIELGTLVIKENDSVIPPQNITQILNKIIGCCIFCISASHENNKH